MPVDSVTLRARSAEGGPSEDDDSKAEFFPTTFYPDGIFEELPQLHPDLLRPAFLAGQDWEGVEMTKSTPGSVKRVLRAAGAVGVTFLVPTEAETLVSSIAVPGGYANPIFRKTLVAGSPSRD
ncbi:hypothetical protein Bca52824_087159 [Brassica carinata]|uniref:Uncharacterized protein n=1 Tax=Brassica carinata TaxID=52824 RepID=A0A8X7TNC8_BRACI|nr:hypothetical protein Bca52824_087159 [Brassica carinata]